jgi:hypothetical protein
MKSWKWSIKNVKYGFVRFLKSIKKSIVLETPDVQGLGPVRIAGIN